MKQQVRTLTDAQIDATYNHFENGGAKPKGVKLDPRGFRHTMGREWGYSKNGLVEILLLEILL